MKLQQVMSEWIAPAFVWFALASIVAVAVLLALEY